MSKRLIMKKAGLWPIHVFCKLWIEYPVLLMKIISL